MADHPFQYKLLGGDWRISYGPSKFLVAEGSGFSRPYGEKIFKMLVSDWENGADAIERHRDEERSALDAERAALNG